MQAAHGFMQWSPSAKDVGAFINIESTGPWGPDVLFQHQGWALNAYARAAPRPRGNSVRVQGRRAGVSSYSSPLFWFSLTIFIAPLLCQVAQDFFELGAIPADTDYRVLRESSDKLRIPGIDVAFLFDGLAYHTKEDTWTRIRPGTLQGMGENVLATAVEFMGILNASNLENEEIRSVFADVGGRFMVVYPFWAARVLHVAPLAFHVAFFGRARQAMSDVLAAVALALVLPGLLGVSRALVSGLPLSWYAAYVDLEIRCHSLAPSRCSRCSTPLASGSRSLLPNRSFAHSLARSLARSHPQVWQRLGGVSHLRSRGACRHADAAHVDDQAAGGRHHAGNGVGLLGRRIHFYGRRHDEQLRCRVLGNSGSPGHPL